VTKRSVLVIGSGGREHALTWKLAQSPQVGKIYVAPGNAGTAQLAENLLITATDIPALLTFAQSRKVDLTVVGPDDPLAMGIVDEFRSAGLAIFGPTKAAAQIEASKAFAKDLMTSQQVPTAKFQSFSSHAKAQEYLKTQKLPLVIKADGLALGKGVFICHTIDEAASALDDIMLKKRFGAAGGQVVIEELVKGQEISIHALCDGTSTAMFPTAQDHKPIGEGNTGPNTGGMGVIAPVPWAAPDLVKQMTERTIDPILEGLTKNNTRYTGCLYPGLMISPSGDFNVLEYNARFGDPETQVYMRLLESDLYEILRACVDGTLDQTDIKWRPGFAVTVVLASGGYPGEYQKGLPIAGLEAASKLPDIELFHAGTSIKDGDVVTAGGRVLNVTATGATLKQALDHAYEAVDQIKFEGMYFRRDIGAKAASDWVDQFPADITK